MFTATTAEKGSLMALNPPVQDVLDNHALMVLSGFLSAHPPWPVEVNVDEDGTTRYTVSYTVKGIPINLGVILFEAENAVPDVEAMRIRALEALNMSMAQACALVWLGKATDLASLH
jgi:hypothetical protein